MKIHKRIERLITQAQHETFKETSAVKSPKRSNNTPMSDEQKEINAENERFQLESAAYLAKKLGLEAPKAEPPEIEIVPLYGNEPSEDEHLNRAYEVGKAIEKSFSDYIGELVKSMDFSQLEGPEGAFQMLVAIFRSSGGRTFSGIDPNKNLRFARINTFNARLSKDSASTYFRDTGEPGKYKTNVIDSNLPAEEVSSARGIYSIDIPFEKASPKPMKVRPYTWIA